MRNLDGWMMGRMDGKDDWTPPQVDKTKDIIYIDGHNVKMDLYIATMDDMVRSLLQQ